MRQFATIAINALMELGRQPVFLLLMTASAFFEIFLASVPYFGFGDDPKLVKDSVLALMFLAGLLAAVLCASNTVSREIHTGTALAVLAKPVGRGPFLVAKFVGLVGALTLLTYVNLLAALLASRMAYDAYGSTDWIGLGTFCGALLAAYVAAGFSNYFLRRPFVADAVLAVVVMVTVTFVGINFVSKEGGIQPFGEGVDWRMIRNGLLILFAVWLLAALALACSTRLELVSTLMVCCAWFLLGLVSDYLLGRPAEAGVWWAKMLYTVVPNWQLFWLADALEEGRQVPWRYLAWAFGYMTAYVGAAVAVALYFFEERELH